MNPPYLTEEKINFFIQNALEEDVGQGDFSSLASIPPTSEKRARLIIKGEGILAGVELAKKIVQTIDSSLQLDIFLQDGSSVKKGDIGFTLNGKVHSILKAERLVLNCMQRMSGIATYTHYLASKIAHTKTKLLDTRKTTPNCRIIEKWAVYIGGGVNHRFGLFDMIMLKDNHIDFAGGVKQAILATKDYLKKNNKNLKIEIEVRNQEELKQVLEVGGIDRIMLDNMSVPELKESVQLIKNKYEVEASGGITENTIREMAETGVDFISVGALTHSFKSMDISLKAF